MNLEQLVAIGIQSAKRTKGRLLVFEPKSRPGKLDLKPVAEETLQDHVVAVIWPDGGVDYQQPIRS